MRSEVKETFPIVGIGASAGGLESFSQLLKNLPNDTDMGFVIVQHLDPAHESILTELLAKVSNIPISEANNNTKVKPNHVYVIPPNANLKIKAGYLKLSARKKIHGQYMIIDQFLRSLANDQRERAISIILSGTGTDGTLGLQEIKARGGITFAQEEKTAAFTGMPHSAIVNAHVDFVLPVEEIAKELIRISQHHYLNTHEKSVIELLIPEGNDLNKIFEILENTTGADFAYYKRNTMKRRIQRRMSLHKINSLANYITYLKNHPAEIEDLYNDILICVTNFFRDPQVFQYLKYKIFPQIIKNKPAKDPIRIWVPGCATGEEVYSLAICLLESLGKMAGKIPIQIFGTDISGKVIERARSGIYIENIEIDVSTEQLDNFFTRVNGHYQINQVIREMCTFAKQNVISDPPFSRLDLISCRNLLIYLEPVLQKRVIPIFHYSLKPNGYLILGSSESVGEFTNLFMPKNKKYSIYAKASVAANLHPEFRENKPTIAKKQIRIDNKPTATGEEALRLLKTYLDQGKITDKSKVSKDNQIIRLIHAISAIRVNPQTKIEELETNKERLQIANEEILSSNEELQSMNEELETSKEELQSTNEELMTVNEELKNRQDEIIQANNDLNNLITSVNIPIIILDNNLRIRRFTPGAQALMNLIPSDIGRPIGNIRPNITVKDLETPILDVLRTGSIKEIEIQDSKAYWYLMRLFPYKTTSNKIDGAVMTFIDFTKQRRNIENMKFLSEISKTLVSSLDLKTTLSNIAKLAVPKIGDWCSIEIKTDKGIEQLTIAHVEPKKIKWEKELRKTNPPDPHAPKGVPNVLRTGKSEFYSNIPNGLLVKSARSEKELALLRKLELSSAMIVPLTVKKETIGAITFVAAETRMRYTKTDLAIAEEVASRAALAIEKARLFLEAQNAINLRDDFITIASHELKTPITSLKIYAQVLQNHFKKSGETKLTKYATNMDDQINKLTELISDLLNVSKLRRGKLEFNMEMLDLNEVVKDSIDAIQPTTKHNLIIKGKINKNVYADRNRIYQVLTNLLTNAIKYSPRANKVIIQLTPERNVVVISLQDFGIGIEEDQQKKIFQEFYRVTSDNEKRTQGLGMGLYIVKEIIKRHRGNINVVSSKKKGTIFSFTLPYKKRQ